MWSKVAIVRDGEGLAQATRQLASWQESLGQAAGHLDYEIRNMVLVGRLIAEAALIREESRGAHYRGDFPSTEPIWQRHIVFTS
jgi:L-aspartate oxidase